MMKKLSVLIFVVCCFTIAGFGQKNHAINQKLIIDDNELVITYDLPPNGTHRAFNVSLISSSEEVKPRTVSGTGKNISAGNNLMITWYYTYDNYSRQDLSNLKINVLAIDPLEGSTSDPGLTKSTTVRKVPAWAGLGAVGLTGITLITTGAISEGNAQDDYDIYKDNKDPNDALFSETTRDGVYDDANSKHKKAQLIMAGGAAILVTGGIIYVNRLIQDSRLAKSGLSLFSEWNVVPVPGSSGGIGTAGVGIRFSF